MPFSVASPRHYTGDPMLLPPSGNPFKYYKEVLSLNKNQNSSKSSEHPPVRGEKMAKHLGGIKDCKYKTFSWHLNGFPDGNGIGSTV